jgi:hypothetical protein
MKLLSIFMLLQGLTYVLSSINNWKNSNLFKYGVKYFNTDFHIIGIILGILFIFSGIGIRINKRKAYYLGLILYMFLILYGSVSTVYFIIVDGFELGLILSSLIILLFFCFLSKYIYKKIKIINN